MNVNDHYPYNKWLFHWEYTLFSDKPIWRCWWVGDSFFGWWWLKDFSMVNLWLIMVNSNISGWWFGTIGILFSISCMGCHPSQQTNSYFSERLFYHQPVYVSLNPVFFANLIAVCFSFLVVDCFGKQRLYVYFLWLDMLSNLEDYWTASVATGPLERWHEQYPLQWSRRKLTAMMAWYIYIYIYVFITYGWSPIVS